MTALRDGAPFVPHPQAFDASATAKIAGRARAMSFEALPRRVVAVAKHCFLDWLGVTIAGAAEPAAVMVREFVLAEKGAPQATLVGTGEAVSASQAALVNGTASHALDFDDVVGAMSGHPSVPVLPAVLATAEQEGLDGRALLVAFVAGFETECRVGRLVAPDHYAAGWHATGTVGTFGAAAGVAHALSLDEPTWRTALGIAGTQAAGLKSMFGTMCKPLHAGKAASNGLLAARLAERGFTSNMEVLQDPQGFAATHTRLSTVPLDPAVVPEGFDIEDVLFKFHAACYFTHSCIEGILRLRDEEALSGDSVRSVEVRVPPQHLAACNILDPTTPLEAKFSLRHTAALALSDHGTGKDAFTPELVADPTLAALRERVSVTPEAGLTDHHTSEVVLTTTDGHELRTMVDMSEPAREDDAFERQWDKLVHKFHSLTEPVIEPERASRLVEIVADLDSCRSVHDLLRTTTAPAR